MKMVLRVEFCVQEGFLQLRNSAPFYDFSKVLVMSALFQFSLDSESYFGQYKEMKCRIKDTLGFGSVCTV